MLDEDAEDVEWVGRVIQIPSGSFSEFQPAVNLSGLPSTLERTVYSRNIIQRESKELELLSVRLKVTRSLSFTELTVCSTFSASYPCMFGSVQTLS